MTIISKLTGKAKLIQAGILALIVAAATIGMATGNLTKAYTGGDKAEQLTRSLHRTQEQSKDVSEAAFAVGTTVQNMSGGQQTAAPVEAVARQPVPTVPPPPTVDDRPWQDIAATRFSPSQADANLAAAPPPNNQPSVFPSDAEPGTEAYQLDQMSGKLTEGRELTAPQIKADRLQAEWNDRYQRAVDETESLYRYIADTHEYKNMYFSVQEERAARINLSASNGNVIQQAMRDTLTRQRAAFAKWAEAADEVEAKAREIMRELDNLNELMQFNKDAATYDAITAVAPEIGVNTMLLHDDIGRLLEASLELNAELDDAIPIDTGH